MTEASPVKDSDPPETMEDGEVQKLTDTHHHQANRTPERGGLRQSEVPISPPETPSDENADLDHLEEAKQVLQPINRVEAPTNARAQ